MQPLPALISCTLLALAAGPAAAAPSVAELWQRAAAAYDAGDVAGFGSAMSELAVLRPYNLGVAKNLARAEALAGRPAAALAIIEGVAGQGLVVSLQGDGDFESLLEQPGAGAVVERMADNLRPVGEADRAFTVPRHGVLPEGLAHDPVSGDFLVGSVRTGHIYRVSPGGAWSVFAEPDAENGLAGVFGMKADGPARRLVVAAASPPQHRGPNADASSGVLVFDLDSGRLLRRALTGAAGHLLGDVAIGPEGDVYASDSLSPVVFRLPAGGGGLEPWLVADAGALPNLQGLAVSADGGSLYLADYHRGLFRVDLGDRNLTRLSHPASLNLGGIDGLYAVGGRLLAIQNGVTPQRILALELAQAGDAVASAEVLARALPGWNEPTLGVVVGNELYYNAASGWPDFDGEGNLSRPAAAGPITVMRLMLD